MDTHGDVDTRWTLTELLSGVDQSEQRVLAAAVGALVALDEEHPTGDDREQERQRHQHRVHVGTGLKNDQTHIYQLAQYAEYNGADTLSRLDKDVI